MRLEMAASNVQPESETRVTVSDAYEKIIQAMMGSLDSIARESDQTGDDKEQLNATIMYIGIVYSYMNSIVLMKLLYRKYASYVQFIAYKQTSCT